MRARVPHARVPYKPHSTRTQYKPHRPSTKRTAQSTSSAHSSTRLRPDELRVAGGVPRDAAVDMLAEIPELQHQLPRLQHRVPERHRRMLPNRSDRRGYLS
eukprot:124120-Rhodomonas_salina.1